MPRRCVVPEELLLAGIPRGGWQASKPGAGAEREGVRRRALRMEACRASTSRAELTDDGRIEEEGGAPGAPGGGSAGGVAMTGNPLPC